MPLALPADRPRRAGLRRQVSSQPVLYLCLEDTFNRIQSRLLQIDGEGGSPNLLFQTRSGGIGQGLEAEITTALNHHPGISASDIRKQRFWRNCAAPQNR